MKDSFFALILIVIFLSCYKEENEKVTPAPTEKNTIIYSEDGDNGEELSSRTGLRDNVFFRKSLTLDNWLKVPSVEPYRKHLIFNKRKIQSINFQKTGQGSASINGVLVSHYRIQVVYNDGSPNYQFTAFSKDSLNQFTFSPANSLNLLTTTHTGKVITLELQRPGLPIWNWWRDQTYQYNLCVVSKDGVIMGQRYIDPIDKNNLLYVPTHVH